MNIDKINFVKKFLSTIYSNNIELIKYCFFERTKNRDIWRKNISLDELIIHVSKNNNIFLVYLTNKIYSNCGGLKNLYLNPNKHTGLGLLDIQTLNLMESNKNLVKNNLHSYLYEVFIDNIRKFYKKKLYYSGNSKKTIINEFRELLIRLIKNKNKVDYIIEKITIEYLYNAVISNIELISPKILKIGLFQYISNILYINYIDDENDYSPSFQKRENIEQIDLNYLILSNKKHNILYFDNLIRESGLFNIEIVKTFCKNGHRINIGRANIGINTAFTAELNLLIRSIDINEEKQNEIFERFINKDGLISSFGRKFFKNIKNIELTNIGCVDYDPSISSSVNPQSHTLSFSIIDNIIYINQSWTSQYSMKNSKMPLEDFFTKINDINKQININICEYKDNVFDLIDDNFYILFGRNKYNKKEPLPNSLKCNSLKCNSLKCNGDSLFSLSKDIFKLLKKYRNNLFVISGSINNLSYSRISQINEKFNHNMDEVSNRNLEKISIRFLLDF